MASVTRFVTAAQALAQLLTVDGAGSGLDADLLDGQSSTFYLAASSYTAADVLTKLLTVDGAGSGLDADLLDGNSSAFFCNLSTTQTIGGTKTFSGNVTVQFTAADDYAGGIAVKKRGTAGDTNGSIANGGELGYHGFFGWDGSAYSRGALVLALATEAWSGSARGTSYSIYVTTNGTTTNNEWFKLDHDGNIYHYGITAFGPSITPGAYVDIAGSLTTKAALRFRTGTAPTSPNDGDVWFDGSALKIRISGVTKTFTVT